MEASPMISHPDLCTCRTCLELATEEPSWLSFLVAAFLGWIAAAGLLLLLVLLMGAVAEAGLL